MKKSFSRCGLLASLMLFAATSCSITDAAIDDSKLKPEVPADKSKFHVVVLMGQSNMEGAGYPVFPEYIKGTPRVLCMNEAMEWKQATLTPSPTSGMSPGYVFARQYADMHPGVTVGYIQCALGGRSLAQLSWGDGAEKKRNGKTVYQDSIDRILAAKKVGEVKAILWHQGETDSGMQNYVEKLAEYVARVRKDSALPDVPFIVGELGKYADWMRGYNERIQKVEGAIPNCKLVSSTGLIDRGDKLHFSSFSVNAFGSRYLDKYLQLKEPALAKKFAPKLEKIEKETAENEAKWVDLFNGDMSLGETRPMGWDHVGWGVTGIQCFRDTKVYASKPASLRMEANGRQQQIGTMLRNLSGKYRLTCKIKNEGCSKCALVMPGARVVQPGQQNAQPQQRPGAGGPRGGGFGGGAPLVDGTSATDWKEFSVEFTANGGATLSFQVDGNGKAWLDDIKLEKIQ